MAAPRNLKLEYFPAAGRGISIRLSCAVAQMEFDDVRVQKEDWMAKKPTTPWGSMPILYVDGAEVGQTRAILRCVSKLGGLYPSDPILAAHCDAIVDVCEELLGAPMSIPMDERAAACEPEGKIGGLYAKLESFVASTSNGQFAVGDNLSMADVALFGYMGNLSSGFFDNVVSPYKSCPTLLECRRVMCDNEQVQAYLALEKNSGTMWDFHRKSVDEIKADLGC